MLDKFNFQMGVMTISIGARANQPPSQSGYLLISVESGNSYVFNSSDFTTNTIPEYIDPEGDEMESIKLTGLPITGSLKKGGIEILVDDIITKSELDSGQLIYETNIGDEGYEDSYATFVISDVGSSTFTSSPKAIYISVEKIENKPPSQIGDNEVSIEIGSEFVFTRNSLTTDLTPEYLDPEGNPAYQLRIDSLPAEGKLTLSGTECYKNQIINFSDIDLGLFKYIDPTELGSSESSFSFSVSDSVSQKFTS